MNEKKKITFVAIYNYIFYNIKNLKINQEVIKMKNKLFYVILTLGVVILFASGCQKAPQAQLDLAQAALDSAKIVQADRYLADEFNAIQDTFNMAVAAVESVKSESIWKRNYKDAASQLDRVKADADMVIANTAAKKEEVKKEADALIAEVTSLVADDKALIVKAPKGKEGKAALDAIQQDITVIESTIAEASGVLSQGDFLTAKDKLVAAKEKALSIQAELQTAIDKYKKR